MLTCPSPYGARADCHGSTGRSPRSRQASPASQHLANAGEDDPRLRLLPEERRGPDAEVPRATKPVVLPRGEHHGHVAERDVLAKALTERLQRIREGLRQEMALLGKDGDPADLDEWAVLSDETAVERWLPSATALARQCPPASDEQCATILHRPGDVVFEGAQGVLLDEWRGFHPHTTWSSISTAAVDSVGARFGLTEPIEHFGVLRTYLTRHGAGIDQHGIVEPGLFGLRPHHFRFIGVETTAEGYDLDAAHTAPRSTASRAQAPVTGSTEPDHSHSAGPVMMT